MNYYNSLYANLNITQTYSRYQALRSSHSDNFGVDNTAYFSSSGRCELLGNHTDHNGGRVLVGTINLDIIACANIRQDNIICMHTDLGIVEIDLTNLSVDRTEYGTTTSLVRGVCHALTLNGYRIGGFNATTSSNIPYGSGLSSSAAFELLVCTILNYLYNGNTIRASDCAVMSQYAENVHFNKPCGLLDQFGIACGGITYVDFANSHNIKATACQTLPNRSALIIRTRDDHSNLTNLYAQIGHDMRSVASMFGADILINADRILFQQYYATHIHTQALDRAQHFYTENDRVDEGFYALSHGDYDSFYSAINSSGESSRYLLGNCSLPNETNSPICDIIDSVLSVDSKCAIRVHGGGFRGGVLVFSDNPERIKQHFAPIYGQDNIIDIQFRQRGTTVVDIDKLFG
ncbi:MAG: galactokinase family protein [Clostridia bacterium]|nr:galactokinase family protein [Clostridia bacterium]